MLYLKLTASLPLKIGHFKRKRSSCNHPFSGAKYVSFREGNESYKFQQNKHSCIFLHGKGHKTRILSEDLTGKMVGRLIFAAESVDGIGGAEK